MGDLQHFCLRWNNYQSSITSAFENLRDDEDFVDVTLACEGKSLKAHRVVLSACSPYFRELLKSTPCKHPVIVLQDVVFEDLHALVEFIYHGEVNVHQQSLSSFLKTAEVLRVSGLTQQAEATGISEKWCRDGIAEERGSSPSHLPQRPGRPPLTSLHHRTPHRERPCSAGEANENQQDNNSVPMKRAKTSSESLNHMLGDREQQQVATGANVPGNGNGGGNKPETDSDQEPPVDFSTSTNSSGKQPSGGGGGGNAKRELSLTPSSAGGGVGDLPSPLNNLVKSEPIDMATCQLNASGEHEDSNDSANDIISEPGSGVNLHGGPHDHDDMVPSTGGHPNYLDSKLFAAAGASFNFSMAAALAADSLAGLNNQSHVSGVDGLAGTSQEHEGRDWADAAAGLDMDDGYWADSLVSGALPDHQSGTGPCAMMDVSDASIGASAARRTTCGVCGKRFSRSWSLQRHVMDMHCPSEGRHHCVDCGRSYRSRNSLISHRCQYHGKSKPVFDH